MSNAIDESAINAVERLVRDSEEPKIVLATEDRSVTLVRKHLVDAAALVAPEPLAAALEVSQLSSLVAFVGAHAAQLRDHFVIVDGPEQVRLLSPLKGYHRKREALIVAKLARPAFPFGSWMVIEDFVIRVQTAFADTPDKDKVLAIAGNVREEAVRTSTDDGVTQTVATRVGIARAAEVEIPKLVVLKPWRTFCEVEQPASSFLFRMKGGSQEQRPCAALFEADGGSWRETAQELVAHHLVEKFRLSVEHPDWPKDQPPMQVLA